jgi:hypothetical protein
VKECGGMRRAEVAESGSPKIVAPQAWRGCGRKRQQHRQIIKEWMINSMTEGRLEVNIVSYD